MRIHPHHLLQLLAIVVLGALAIPAASQTPTGRNILFIAIDDLRDWTGYNGNYAGTIHTPNIDALASVSTRFNNAYAAVPNCLGSRTTVMSGLSPATHQVGLDFNSLGGVNSPAYSAIYDNPSVLTLPEVLSSHGYYSAAAGKVFHVQVPDKWDQVGPATNIVSLANPFDPGPDGTFIAPQVLPPGEVHPDQAVTDWAVGFIGNYNQPNPFFLAVGLYQPHLPWILPQWAYDMYPLGTVVAHTPTPGDLDDESSEAQAIADRPSFLGQGQYDLVENAGKALEYTQAYLAAISHTDAMVGLLLTALLNSPFASNTDIILWSDNGYHLGHKFHWRKTTFWESAVRVPLLVSSPGNANYPVIDENRAVSLLDIAPTVLDLAGLPPFVQFEGAPLHDVANSSPVEIYVGDGRATVINGEKFVDYDLGKPGNADIATYDLLTDPQELVNLTPPPAGC